MSTCDYRGHNGDTVLSEALKPVFVYLTSKSCGLSIALNTICLYVINSAKFVYKMYI